MPFPQKSGRARRRSTCSADLHCNPQADHSVQPPASRYVEKARHALRQAPEHPGQLAARLRRWSKQLHCKGSGREGSASSAHRPSLKWRGLLAPSIDQPQHPYRRQPASVCITRVDVDTATHVRLNVAGCATVGGIKCGASACCACVEGETHQRIELLLCELMISYALTHCLFCISHPGGELYVDIGNGDWSTQLFVRAGAVMQQRSYPIGAMIG